MLGASPRLCDTQLWKAVLLRRSDALRDWWGCIGDVALLLASVSTLGCSSCIFCCGLSPAQYATGGTRLRLLRRGLPSDAIDAAGDACGCSTAGLARIGAAST